MRIVKLTVSVILILNNFSVLIFRLYFNFYTQYELGYWHQRAGERHGNPPPR